MKEILAEICIHSRAHMTARHLNENMNSRVSSHFSLEKRIIIM